MNRSDNAGMRWLVAATLVLAATGGVVFFVARAHVKAREAAEQHALLVEREALSDERRQLFLELVDIDRTVWLQTKLTPEEQDETKAEDRRNASPATGGHPRNSPEHAAHLQKRIAETEDRLRKIEEEYEARFGPWP